MKIKTSALMSGGKSEYEISLQFAEPKYGKVTVTYPSKSKPNLVVNVSTNVVEEDYGSTTYSVGAISVATTKGQSIQVNSVSNNNWSFVMPANDVIITASEVKQTKPCLDADTIVTLADDRQVKFRDLTENDVVKVWDFDKGEFTTAKLLWLPPVQVAENYYEITLENDVIINLVNNHRAFCPETGRFERMREMVGKCVWHVDGPQKIISVRFVKQPIEYRNAISFHHMNIITNGVLTSTGFNNLYPIENMKYVKSDRQVRTEDEFGLDHRWFQGLRLYEHYTKPSEAQNCIAILWGGDQWLIA